MPSMRRIRLLVVAAVVATVLILFYASGMQPPADPSLGDFYQKTKHALDRTRHKASTAGSNTKTGGRIPADRDGDGDVDEDDDQAGESLAQRLQAVAQQAKDQANEKGGLRPDAPSKIVGVGSSADGQVKGGVVKEKEVEVQAPFPTKEAGGEEGEQEVVKTEEQLEAEAELNTILKQSPVIVFSKTYCPFSKRAKGILLEKYVLTPQPFIVELDTHPLGPYLQDLLEAKTGRRTVPNILINGVSVGGADELVKMDGEGSLAGKLRDLGQRRVEVAERIGAA